MKIDTQQLENRQVKLTVEVDPSQVDEAKRRAARKIAQSTKIPGFRPGKAPYSIVERHVGESAILEEAIEFLVNDVYPKALDESGLKPYGPGALEGIPSKDPMTFEFVIPLEAVVELPDYRAVRLDYNRETVDENQVEQTVNNIREQQAEVTPVERPAQEGDEVTVKLGATRKEVKEGESPTFIRERSVPIIVRPEGGDAEAGDEWPYAGFSRSLVGMSIGDERTITYTFPEESAFELLRGTQVDYHFVVEGVKERKLPALDDELAKSMGEYGTLEEMRTDIHDRLEKQSKETYDSEYEDKILDQLISESKIEYPPQMLEDEIDSLIRQLENRLSYQGLDMDAYLKSRSMDMPALREELKEGAVTRLKKFLVVREVAEKEDVHADPQEVQNETTNWLASYTRGMNPSQAKKVVTQELVANLITNVTSDLTIHATLERLRAIAAGENPELPVHDHNHGEETAEETAAPKKKTRKAAAKKVQTEEIAEAAPETVNEQPPAEKKTRKTKKSASTESE